jgi:hypothetical protein
MPCLLDRPPCHPARRVTGKVTMRRLSHLAAAAPLLILASAAAAAPVSVTFSGFIAANVFDPLGAFGTVGADLAGEAVSTTISFDTTLHYTASGSDDQYSDAAPGTGATTISVTIGGVTLTKSSSYAGLLAAISIGADTEALGHAADAPGDMLGYGVASTTAWAPGEIGSSAGFGALLATTDPNQAQYLEVGAAPVLWEYLPFTSTDAQIIAEPAAAWLLPVALLGLVVVRGRASRRRLAAPVLAWHLGRGD